jgi:Tfp pilus assembly protein PilV
MRFSPGQNLLEAVIAIGIILTAVIGSSSLIVTTITAGRVSQNRTEAANFAREGIEIVRSLRDSNWLKFEQNQLVGTSLPVWNTGLTTGSYILTYHATPGWFLVSCGTCSNDTSRLYATVNTANGGRSTYNQYLNQTSCANANIPGSCSATKYSRVIRLTLATDGLGTATLLDDQPYLLVESTVNWTARSGPTTLTSQVRLYDWK